MFVFEQNLIKILNNTRKLLKEQNQEEQGKHQEPEPVVGTGVTACAIARAIIDQKVEPCTIETKGGQLMVRFQTKDFAHFTHIHLIGPATKVFEGTY